MIILAHIQEKADYRKERIIVYIAYMHDFAEPWSDILFEPQCRIYPPEYKFIDSFQHRISIMGIYEADKIAEILIRQQKKYDGNPVADYFNQCYIKCTREDGKPKDDYYHINDRPYHNSGALDRSTIFQ
jgi:hypothetical protein